MHRGILTKEELTEQRTPSQMADWVRQKSCQIYYSGGDGRRAFRLYNEGPTKVLMKKFHEEAFPLAVFGTRKFGDTDQIRLQLVMDDTRFDALVTDLRTSPPTRSPIEITQSHEGEDDYWRRVHLFEKGYVFPYAPVDKTGPRGETSQAFPIPPKANSVDDRVSSELERIVAAAKRKETKNYPPNTSLVICFDDAPPFHEVMDDVRLDGVVIQRILNAKLAFRFSALYLVGRRGHVFREFSLV